MTIENRRSTNWGCLTALLLMAPMVMIVSNGMAGDDTPVWLMAGGVIAFTIGLGLVINAAIDVVRYWRERRKRG